MDSTTISLIVTAVVVVIVFMWLIRSRKKQARHLDDLHITSEATRAGRPAESESEKE